MMNDYATFPVAFALIAAVLEKAKEGLAFSWRSSSTVDVNTLTLAEQERYSTYACLDANGPNFPESHLDGDCKWAA